MIFFSRYFSLVWLDGHHLQIFDRFRRPVDERNTIKVSSCSNDIRLRSILKDSLNRSSGTKKWRQPDWSHRYLNSPARRRTLRFQREHLRTDEYGSTPAPSRGSGVIATHRVVASIRLTKSHEILVFDRKRCSSCTLTSRWITKGSGNSKFSVRKYEIETHYEMKTGASTFSSGV